MKRSFSVLLSLFFVSAFLFFAAAPTGCANIIPPTGGPRDTLPPVLISAQPRDSAVNYNGDRLTLTFNEYVNIDNAQENVLVSPVPKNLPIIDYKLRNVTVRLRDTLEPNTTYSINFGNAIKDVNEGNVYKNFTYVFSTGPYLDENELAGKVTLAETGKADSTLIAVLYRSTDDSAVAKEKPRYVARVDGKGNFMFRNLPSGTFSLFAVPNSFTLRYDDSTRPFAFAAQPINTDSSGQVVQLYAYSKSKPPPARGSTTTPPSKEKVLRFSSNLTGSLLDFLDPLQFNFNKPVTTYDTNKIRLMNEDLSVALPVSIEADTNQTRFVVKHNWIPNTAYNLVFEKEAFADSTGLTLARQDTLSFTTKKEEDYGSLKIRFNNLDLTQHPVLQLVQNDVPIISEALTQRDWTRKLVKPGAYEVRILLDTNQNGRWDAGEFFGVRRQPERVIDLGISLDVTANWDNEKEITLQ